MFSLRLQSSKCFVPCFLGCVQSSVLIEYWQGTHLCCFGYAVLWPSGSPLTVLGSELAENHCLQVIILWPSFHRGISKLGSGPWGCITRSLIFPPCHGCLHFWWFHKSAEHPSATAEYRLGKKSLLFTPVMFPRVFFSAPCGMSVEQ